jgi:hypothetical protein
LELTATITGVAHADMKKERGETERGRESNKKSKKSVLGDDNKLATIWS